MQTIIQIGVEEVKEYCELQDRIKKRRLDLKEELKPFQQRLDTLKPPLIKFLAESEDSYAYNGKTVTIKRSNRKEPINASFVTAVLEKQFASDPSKAEAILSVLENNRQVQPTITIARVKRKDVKEVEPDIEEDGEEDDDDDDDDNNNE